MYQSRHLINQSSLLSRHKVSFSRVAAHAVSLISFWILSNLCGLYRTLKVNPGQWAPMADIDLFPS